MTTPTKNEQNTSLFWSDEKLKEMRTDFEIHVKSISNMIQWALTLGEHESEEFRNELKAISQRTEPALKEVLFIGSNFLSIFDAKFVAARSGNNSGSGGLVYNGVKQIILSTKDFLDDPRNIVPVIKNLVNDLQDSFLKFVNAVKNWATIQAELSNVLKKGSASIKNFIRNKGFSNLVDTAIAKGFSNFLDPKLIAGNSRSKLFNLAVAIITGAGFGNTDGVVSDPQSTQKTIIQNILGAVFGIVGGGALATLFMPAAAGTVATITIGVLAGIVADFVWEYAVPKSWKQLGTDVLSDIYDHVVAHRTILIKGVESLFPGPTFIIEEVTDSVITYFIEDDRIERKLPVPVAKHQGDKLDILKPVSKDKYKSLFEQVIDTGKIRTLIVNGETFTIDDAVSSIIIRNNLDKIAPETFVTSHILIKPGEKLQLGNGKDYYEVKANDTIASIAKSNHMMVKELVTLNPWLADDNRIKFYQNKLILPNETSLATDTHTSHEYGDEGTRNTVAHSNKASSHNNSNHAFTAADTSAHDYFADFDGGDDKFYGSLKGGDTFAGGKGNDIYYINFNGERSDTIIDEGKNELHVIDEKGNVVRLTGGSRNKDTMPERTFVSDDGHYVFHVDEHNMLSVLRAEDVKKAGNGDLSEGMTKIIANKKTKHHASKKQPAGGYANNPGSSNAGAGNAGGNHSNTGNSGSNHSDSGKNQAGNPSAVPEPKEIRVPNFGNGGFGINLKDDPQEPDPFPSVPEPAPDSAPGYGDAPRTSSPIIFDLNGDGVTTVAKDSDIIRFDLDNNGFAERTGWVNKYDGLLVRDLNGNGRIDNGGELFGNYTKLANGQMAANGFEALNDLDDNHDGQITAADTAWKTLRIWQDSNQDAHSAKGELSTLDELGITSISTKYQNSTEIDTAGNAHKQISSARRSDGSSIAVSDVWFTTHLADTSQKNKKAVSSEIALLPNIRSFGNVPDLHQAMIVNQKLKQAVETYLASNKKQRTAQIDSLIYLWTGVAGVPANSRGIYIDGRQLAALEALTGEPFLQLGRNPNPNHGGGPILAAEYNKFAHYVAAHLDAYGNPLFIRYHDREAGREIYNFNKLNSYIQMLILDNKLDEIANIGQIIQGLIAYDSYQKDLWQKNVHKFILSDYRWAYLITSSYTEGTKSADTLHGKVSNEF
ncbi:LysM peptidoglycan-binding domain-containing protein, partial [Kingella denitrificans]